MSNLKLLTVQQYYHRLRKRYNPSFSPRYDVEIGWWEKVEKVCKDIGIDQYEAIDKVFALAETYYNPKSKDPMTKRGYPTVSDMTKREIVSEATKQQSMLGYTEREVNKQIMLISAQAIKQKLTIMQVCEKLDWLQIWPLTRVILAPSLRRRKLTTEQKQKVLQDAVDPMAWKAFEKAGVTNQEIEATKTWCANLSAK